MSELILPESTKKEETKPEDIAIPTVNQVTFGYKKDTKMFYVVIPADRTDAFTASCIFDNMKLTYLQIVQALMKEFQEKQSKIYKPGMLASMKNFVAGKK